jgi:hypothetical protein
MIYSLLVSLPILAHLVLAVYISGKISKSILLTKKQKRLNVLLAMAIPFLWSILLYYILKKEPDYFDKRKIIANSNLEERIFPISDLHPGSYHHH